MATDMVVIPPLSLNRKEDTVMKINKRETPQVIAGVLLSHETWHFTPNYEYAEVWVESIQKIGAHGVIIHDGCVTDERLLNAEGIEFIEIKKEDRVSEEAWNERYFLYLNFLNENEWIERAFFTDIRDIWFYVNPLDYFSDMMDNGYFVTQEEWDFAKPETEYMRRISKVEHKGAVEIYNLPQYTEKDTVPFCAGAFGGNRNACISLFGFIASAWSKELDVPEWDMGIYNAALHAGAAGNILTFCCNYDIRQCADVLYEFQEKMSFDVISIIKVKDRNGEHPAPLFHDEPVSKKELKSYRDRIGFNAHYGKATHMERSAFTSMIANDRKWSLVAEIGVENGMFMKLVMSKTDIDKWYGIDAWRLFSQEEYPDDINKLGEENMYDNLKAAAMVAKDFGNRICLIRELSGDAVDLFPDNLFDAVYIDANHSYKGSKEDITAWLPKVRDGGVMCGHDYINYHNEDDGVTFGVKRAVDEIFEDEVITLQEDYPSWYYLK